jgi:glucose 1-dehydrogenase
MVPDLSGNVAVISGGLGDIGRETALELARRGAEIAICDVRPELDAQAIILEIRNFGRRARYDRVDVSDAQGVTRWFDAVTADLGLPTLIIPSAAIVDVGTFPELNVEHWRRELSVNLDGAFYVAREAARRLLERGSAGRVVFVGSWAAEHVHLQIPTYCVAKAGIRMLTKCMAGALADRDILVNEIAPGFVDGGLAGKFANDDSRVREASERQIPIRRFIRPEEVARQIAHLCDPENRHMTGATVLMDGGLSLFGSGVLTS